MGTYYCEGFIKEVKVAADGKVSFTIEPTTPYLFEKKEGDGKTKRLLLMVDYSKRPIEALILDDAQEQEFSAPEKCDFSSILIAKANRLKVRVTSDFKNDMTDETSNAKNSTQSKREIFFDLYELKVL